MILSATWRELEENWSASTGYCTRRLNVPGPAPIYIGVAKPENSRALLVVGRAAPGFTPPDSRGLIVKLVEPSVGGPGTLTMAVILRDRSFADIFDAIVEDIARALSSCSDEAAALDALASRVALWHLFLEKQSARGLGRDAQIGLYGELRFMRSYVIPALGTPGAIASWTGPRSGNQDFQLGSIAFEVKSTAAKQHQRLWIASERQLDTTGLESLVLVHLSFDERQHAGETLPDIVAAIRREGQGDPLALANLTDRLLAAGYVDEQASLYTETGYTLREHNFFLVNDTFPRITERDLRKGVGDVQYTISVAECMHHAIEESEVIASLGRAARAS